MAISGLEIVIVILAILNFAQGFWINKLINKLMSRNYYDYEITQSLSKPKKEATMVKVTEEPMEDPAYLGGLG